MSIPDFSFPLSLRSLRTSFVGCASDSEYLAKLHCLRLAFDNIMRDESVVEW